MRLSHFCRFAHDGSGLLRRDTGGCLGLLHQAGHLQHPNTDQGSQFSGAAFTGVLADNGFAIRMDGKGAWRANVFVERLVAQRQIRRGVSASLPKRRRGAQFDPPRPRFLQQPPTASKP